MPEEPTHDPDVLTAYGLSQEVREAMAAALQEAFGTAGPDFGAALRDMQASVAHVDPVSLMGVIAMYYGTSPAGSNPEFERRDGMFSHHIELVQGFVLRGSPGLATRALGEANLAVVDAVTKLSQAWMLLEVRKVERAPEAERDLAMALVRLRVHSHAVRGWGYTERLAPMLEDLLAPLDDDAQRNVGLPLSALPGWWRAMGDRIDERLEAHRARVREAVTWPVDERWLNHVRDAFGELPVDDPNVLARLAAASDELRQGFIYHSSDLCAHEIFRFSLDELTELFPAAASPESVRGVLGHWSLAPGDDGGVQAGEVLLANPVLERPFVVSSEDEWHLFCLWLLLHNPFALVEQLLGGHAALLDAYLRRRAEFLERRTVEVLRTALPGAQVEPSVLHEDPADGAEYENDALAVLDSYVIVAEAKGGRLSAEARRGRGRQLRGRVQELLVRPSQQAARLAELLTASEALQRFTRKADKTTFTLDPAPIRRALTVGVTLEPMAEQLPRLAELANVGLADSTVEALSYSISLVDLELVVDLLDHPSEILHYLARRTEIERATWLSGDEMDLLGLYLKTGFNIGEKEFDSALQLNVTGMSDPIDRWHFLREAGMEAERPRVARTEWWEGVLHRLEARRPERWTEIGVAMCNVPPPEQREFEAAMLTLRTDIAAGRRAPHEFVCFENGPPQRRDVFVGLFSTSPRAEERRKHYEAATSVALEASGSSRAIFLSLTLVPTGLPYLALGMVERGR